MSDATVASAQTIDVYQHDYCNCCDKWVEHWRSNGFTPRLHGTQDIEQQGWKLSLIGQRIDTKESVITGVSPVIRYARRT